MLYDARGLKGTHHGCGPLIETLCYCLDTGTFVMSSREVEFAKYQYYGCSALYIYVSLIIALG